MCSKYKTVKHIAPSCKIYLKVCKSLRAIIQYLGVYVYFVYYILFYIDKDIDLLTYYTESSWFVVKVKFADSILRMFYLERLEA